MKFLSKKSYKQINTKCLEHSKIFNNINMSATVATTTNNMPTFMKKMANLAKDLQVSNADIKAKKASKAKGAKEYAKAQKAAAKEEKKIAKNLA